MIRTVDVKERKEYSDKYHDIYLNGNLVETLRNVPIIYVNLIARQYEAFGKRMSLIKSSAAR